MLHLLSTFITSVTVECTPERPQQNDSGSFRPFRGAIGNAQAMDNGLSQMHDPAAKGHRCESLLLCLSTGLLLDAARHSVPVAQWRQKRLRVPTTCAWLMMMMTMMIGKVRMR